MLHLIKFPVRVCVCVCVYTVLIIRGIFSTSQDLPLSDYKLE